MKKGQKITMYFRCAGVVSQEEREVRTFTKEYLTTTETLHPDSGGETYEKFDAGKGSFVFREVAPDAKNFREGEKYVHPNDQLEPPGFMYYDTDHNVWKRGDFELPPGSYTFIGTTKDISEEAAAGICDRWDSGKWNDYNRHLARVDTATESLRSLLIANQMNPELNYAILRKL